MSAMFIDDAEPTRIHDETLVDRIKWTTLARVVLLTAVLIFAVTLDIGVGLRTASPILDAALYRLTTGFFLLSFLTLLATQILQRGPYLRFLAYGSVAIDVAMAMMLVAATDGLQSVFLFAFPLAVLNAALLLRRPGALTAATLATLALAVMTTAHIGWLTLPLLPLRIVVQPGGPLPLDVIVQLAVQVAAVYATSFLSTHLVRELDQSRAKALQQRAELTRLRLRYADVVSSLPDGLLTVGVGGVVTGVNPAGAQILGQDAARVLGQPLSLVLPELTALSHPTNEVWGEMEIAREQDLRQTRELHRDRPDGPQQILACRIAGLHESVDSALPVGRMVVFRDVTQARRQEEQHRDRERLATVGTMAMAVAHEIRNPLASISGAVQMLESSPDLSATDKALMEIVERETRHLSDWIGEFLDFAKPRALQVAPVDLRNLVAETLDAIDHDSRVLAGGIELQRGPGLQTRNARSTKEFLMVGDAALLRQTVWNLVINAAQAVTAADERTVRVTLEEHGTRLKLVVDDSGPGLGVDELAHIFEPFYTTKGEGTGLGLATVKRHVTAHRGDIEAGDSPLGGARFTVLLPRRSSGDTVQSWTRQVPAVTAADKPAEAPNKTEV
jgi:two-component system sensor histidine kinase PilS (NtrC family)